MDRPRPFMALTLILMVGEGTVRADQWKDVAGRLENLSHWISSGASPRTTQEINIKECSIECSITELYVSSGLADYYTFTVSCDDLKPENVVVKDSDYLAQVIIRPDKEARIEAIHTSNRRSYEGPESRHGSARQLVLNVESIRTAVELSELFRKLITACHDRGKAPAAGDRPDPIAEARAGRPTAAARENAALDDAARIGTLEALAEALRASPDHNTAGAAERIWKIIEKQYPPSEYNISVPKLLFPPLLKEAAGNGRPFVVAISPKSIRPAAPRRKSKNAPDEPRSGPWLVTVRFIEVAGHPTTLVDLCLQWRDTRADVPQGKAASGGRCGELKDAIELPAFGTATHRLEYGGPGRSGSLSMRYLAEDGAKFTQTLVCATTLAPAGLTKTPGKWHN